MNSSEVPEPTPLSKSLSEDRARNAVRQPRTIAQAISYARWLRKTPDGLTNTTELREAIDALLAGMERSPTYVRALENNHEVFVLVQVDRAAINAALPAWIDEARRVGAAEEKVAGAITFWNRWRAQPQQSTKVPD